MDKNRETQISKILSWLLRHKGQQEGLKFRPDAFTKVDDILKYKKMKSLKVTSDDLKYIVNSNDKQRFIIKDEDGILWIKATQGHSMTFEDISLKRIENAYEIPEAIHGTYKKYLNNIMKDGLKTMGRTHIHFAIGTPGKSEVISGMRSSCNTLIYLDIQKCLDDGIELYLSENNVVLTSGINNVLEPKYFLKVVDR